MSLRQKRSEWFIGDLEHYAAYYDGEGNWELAEKYLRAVAATLARIAQIPTLGHRTVFGAQELKDLRCLRVERPFQKHLIFYRYDETTIYAERAVHAARDLERRLTEPPSQLDD